MTGQIEALLTAGSALLLAHECLFDAMPAQAERTFEQAEAVFAATREAISTALAAPGDAWERFALLLAAVDVDGIGSPLVARAAAALAKANADVADAA